VDFHGTALVFEAFGAVIAAGDAVVVIAWHSGFACLRYRRSRTHSWRPPGR
jgi:hypothetical protein